MKRLLTFDEFVNENYKVEEAEANGFDPATTSDNDTVVDVVKDLAGLVAGKEYILTVDGTEHPNMMFQGVADGVYIFNSEDQKDVKDFTEDQMSAIVSAGGAKAVAL